MVFQMTERPKCARKDCEEFAAILIGNKMVCGSCFTKWNKIREEKLDELFEEI